MRILSRCDAGVTQAFLDDLEVGAVGVQPRSVGVAQSVHLHVDADAGAGQRGLEYLLAEPPAGEVAVGLPEAGRARSVTAGQPSGRTVDRVRAAAVLERHPPAE
jgi:hypothetical protein